MSKGMSIKGKIGLTVLLLIAVLAVTAGAVSAADTLDMLNEDKYTLGYEIYANGTANISVLLDTTTNLGAGNVTVQFNTSLNSTLGNLNLTYVPATSYRYQGTLNLVYGSSVIANETAGVGSGPGTYIYVYYPNGTSPTVQRTAYIMANASQKDSWYIGELVQVNISPASTAVVTLEPDTANGTPSSSSFAPTTVTDGGYGDLANDGFAGLFLDPNSNAANLAPGYHWIKISYDGGLTYTTTGRVFIKANNLVVSYVDGSIYSGESLKVKIFSARGPYVPLRVEIKDPSGAVVTEGIEAWNDPDTFAGISGNYIWLITNTNGFAYFQWNTSAVSGGIRDGAYTLTVRDYRGAVWSVYVSNTGAGVSANVVGNSSWYQNGDITGVNLFMTDFAKVLEESSTFTVGAVTISVNVDPAEVTKGDYIYITGSTNSGKQVNLTITGPMNGSYTDTITPAGDGSFSFKVDTSTLDKTGTYKVKVETDGTDASTTFTLAGASLTADVSATSVLKGESVTVSGTTNLADTGSVYDVLRSGSFNKVKIWVATSSDPNDIYQDNNGVNQTFTVDISDGTYSKKISTTFYDKGTYVVYVELYEDPTTILKTKTLTFSVQSPEFTLSADKSEVVRGASVTFSGHTTLGTGLKVDFDFGGLVGAATTYTDANGDYSMKITVPSDADIKSYKITATLTDAEGNTHDASVTISVVEQAISISVDKETLIRGDSFTLTGSSTVKDVPLRAYFIGPSGTFAGLTEKTGAENPNGTLVNGLPITVTSEGTFTQTFAVDIGQATGVYKVYVYAPSNATIVKKTDPFDVVVINVINPSITSLTIPEEVVLNEKLTITGATDSPKTGSTTVNVRIEGPNIDKLLTGNAVAGDKTFKVEWDTLQSATDSSKNLAVGEEYTVTVDLVYDGSGVDSAQGSFKIIRPYIHVAAPSAVQIGDDLVATIHTNHGKNWEIWVSMTGPNLPLGDYMKKVYTDENGTATATFVTKGLSEGTYTITARDFSKTKLAGQDEKDIFQIPPDSSEADENSADDDAVYSVDVLLTVTAPAANIQVTDVKVSPSQVEVGEPVTIKATVENSGDLEGSADITLKVAGTEVATKSVSLGPGESDIVSFTVTEDTPGTYNVDVNGVTGSFTVKAKPTPTPPPKTPTPPPATPKPTTPPPTPTPTPEKQPGFEAIFAVVGLLAVAYLLRRRH
jgi:PGF-CTERM protein